MLDIKEQFLKRVSELWDKHESEFTSVLEQSEKHSLNLTFVAGLDFSDPSAVLETQMGFSQVHRDRTEDTFDDPNQPPLGNIAEDAKEEKPKKRGRPRNPEKENGEEEEEEES